MAKIEKDKISTTHETRSLKCALTQDELLQFGDELATLLDEQRKLTEEKESVVKDFKARESAIEAQIAAKQLLVRNKYEYRMVDCDLVLNYTTQKAKVVRRDTDDVVLERNMTPEEKQMDLEFDGESNA